MIFTFQKVDEKVDKMARHKSGSVVTKNGKIYARIRFTDETGHKRDLWKVAPNKVEAKKKIKDLLKVSETKKAKELDASRMTFNQLGDYFEKNYLHEAIYINERKVSGIRNVKPYQHQLKCLRFFFGNRLIQSIQHSHILQYKLEQLHKPLKFGTERKITGINRKLQLLRRILNIAVQQGWIIKNPFHNGDSLISMADEQHRTRILSFDEEKRLFEAIESNPLRFNLKGAVLIALDCALRRGEILTLCRKDIDLTSKTITIRAFNTKTAKTRTVGMTSRVYNWLFQFANLSSEKRIFPIKSLHTTWSRTLKQACIEDFHFHDCRATCISRLIVAGLPHAEAMKISGHSTLACVFRYIRPDESSIHRAANVLENYLLNAQINNSELVENLKLIN